MASGGARKPNRPAAVSGPGALSQRTDGGPGDKQPIRVPTGGGYGETKAATEQQQAAPMSAGGSDAMGGAPAAGATPQDLGVFAPTSMPNQPITAGVPSPTGGMEPDADMVLRQAVMRFPSPWMIRLLRQRG